MQKSYDAENWLTPGQLAEKQKKDKQARLLNGEPLAYDPKASTFPDFGTEIPGPEKRKRSPRQKDRFVDYPAHRDAPKPKIKRPPAEYSNKSRDQLINEILAR